MPFAKAQSVLKKVVPAKQYEKLYALACNAFDVYQKIADNTFYIPKLAVAELAGDKDTIAKISTVQAVLPYTMVSKLGVEATYDTVTQAIEEVKGALVECGVARGGCSALMAMIARHEGKGRKTWLFDSFEGLPPQTEEDGIQKPIRHKGRKANDLAPGYCLGTWVEVYCLIYNKLRLNPHYVQMVKGWFQDTLPEAKKYVGDIAVLRLDGDWYESTKCCLENLYGNVVKGGYIIIDDYQLPGCKKAVDEFLAKNAPNTEIELDKNGRSYFRKV